MRLLTTLSFFVISVIASAQLHVDLVIENPSKEIKDAKAFVVASGGVEPYKYKWSKKNTALTSSDCIGIDEGVTQSVIVTDAKGERVETTFTIKANYLEEHLNSTFMPLVDGLSAVLLWDPFAAIGIYDPVVYQPNGQRLLHANGDPVTTDCWLIVTLLIAAALYFTFYFWFINIRAFKHSIHLVMGKYARPEDKGEVTQFQALSAALSGTLGLGNIALVAVAIAAGGAGATFWMIVAGLIGMSSKFIECTLGVKYRKIDANGEVSGGPMYYLSQGLAKRKMKGLGHILAVLFAIMCVGGALGGGNMIQANQAFAQVAHVVGKEHVSSLWFGIVMAILVGLVIVGGIKSIARVTDKIVPLMVIIYVGFALIIIGINFKNIGSAFAEIWNGAFHPHALKGGFMGVLLMGFRRASFSNEAGIGSASIAHSASKTDRPVSEGIVSLLEPFIDTVIVCTMTALVLIFTGFAADPQGLTGSALTNAAFTSHFPWFDWVLTIAVLLFAYSTMISWSYYGMKSWAYLFGEKKWIKQTFNVLFMCCTVLGTVSGLGSVLDFSDMMILGMAFPNLIGLVILSKEVKLDLKVYMADLKSGVIQRYK